MGEVYRGRDTRLDRSVAIKVLPAELARNAAFKLRFEREAKAISSISHPKICALYDIGESDERAFLVMELVEGESLADRLTRGPLPIDQAIRLGIDVAAALDAAHKRGIVHRDVKPGNIMLTKSGAKLLDFGLAKPNDDDAVGAHSALTQHKPITEQGTIVGTYQYMSPEAIEGRPADARSDLFSLGAVLYEAATGQRAFDGRSRASVIAAILDHEPPPMSVARPMTPPMFDRVVRSLLRKDPEDRVQTAHDLLLQLQWIRESPTSGEAFIHATPKRRANPLPWIAGFLALTTITFAALWLRKPDAKPEVSTFSILSAPGLANGNAVALSPDGRSVAYVSGSPGELFSIWIRRFDAGEPVKIAGTEGASWPFWSPDGTSIGFFARGELKRVNVATGSVQKICNSRYGTGAAWHRDGTILVGHAFNEGLFRVAATGGTPQPVTKLDAARGESVHAWPHLLPDGRHFLHVIRTRAENRNEIAVRPIDGGPAKIIVRADALGGLANGFLFYVRESVLYAHAFDEQKFAIAGEPVEIARNVAYAENWAMSGVAVTGDVIAFYPIFRSRSIVQELDRRGSVLRVHFSDDGVSEPQMSRDGRSIVYSKFDPRKGAMDVWIRDVARGTSRRLTSGLANNFSGRWSPDGRRIGFLSDRAGMYDLYTTTPAGGAPQLVWQNNRDKQDLSFAPDGRLMVMVDMPQTGGDIYWADAPSQPLYSTPLHENDPTVSPDGKWIAFAVFGDSDEANQVYVIPTEGGSPIQISTNGGAHPVWSVDGSEIFYASADRQVVSVPFRNGEAGVPQTLFRLARTTSDHPFSLTPSGNFLVAAYDLEQTTVDRIDVILNWRSLL